MMDPHKFDNDIKNILDQHHIDFDNSEMWDEIEPHLKKKKKRRFVFFWWGLGAIALLLAISLFFIKQSYFWGGEQKVSTTVKKADSLYNYSSIPKTTAKEIADVESVLMEEGCYEEEKNDFLSLVLLKSPDRKTSRRKGNFEDANIDDSYIPNGNTEEDVFIDISEISYLVTEKVKEDTNQLALTSLSREEARVKEKSDKEKVSLSKQLEKEEEKKGKNKRDKKKKKKHKRIRPRHPKIRLFTQLTAAPVAGIRLLSADVENVLNARRDSEKFIESYSLGTGFFSQNRKGFLVYAGLEYLQIQRYAKWKEITITTASRESPIEIVEHINGDVSTTSEDFLVETIRTSRFSTVNKYRFVNFPIGIGYAWKYKKRQLRWYGGVNINLAFRFKGRFIEKGADGLNYIEDLTKDGTVYRYDKYYKKNLGLGAWFALEYSRKINKKMSWIIAPKLQLPFKTVTANKYALKERFIPITVNLGINYLLNNKK